LLEADDITQPEQPDLAAVTSQARENAINTAGSARGYQGIFASLLGRCPW